MCNKFNTAKGCKFGDKCHFAPYVMVRELIVNINAMSGHARTTVMLGDGQAPPASNYKTKSCNNFTKGSCTFGEKCHIAHGAGELRKSAI
ncbi:hypothetical protein PVL29_003401 [Vitis rotundifolia]|uniref:C3H1-type domain-containing protein n=1 Tax=Vitis rotundifolia TaxID=103349 RepID=A0AA39AE22_VITRO|nr:hypothetical protein PVL29_003401 [Vitis rotundifolia]